MSVPFTRERWNILTRALIEYRDHAYGNHIPKGLPQAFHDRLHWYRYKWTKTWLTPIGLSLTTSLEDEREWITPAFNMLGYNPFTNNQLNTFQYNNNQIWNASHPSSYASLPPGISAPGVIPLPAPEITENNRINKTMTQDIMKSVHWSPRHFPYFYRTDLYDNYETISTGYRSWMDGLYETQVTHVPIGGPNIIMSTYTTRLETNVQGLAQIFEPNLIHGAKLQWIAQAYRRDLNISCTSEDSQEDLIQYAPLYPQYGSWGYTVIYEIDIDDDGTCYLPHLISAPFQYTSIRSISESYNLYSYIESGISTNEKWHAWVLNLDNAEFI